MKLGVLPLLIVALLMAAGSGADTVELVLNGDHQIESHRGTLIIAEATVAIPADATVPGPIYVVGGKLTIAGAVESDVIQLAGTVVVPPDGAVTGELRRIAGTRDVAPTARVWRMTELEVVSAESEPAAGYVATAVLALVMAAAGAWTARSRRPLLANVSAAVTDYPLVSVTTGGLVFLTGVAVLVFMGFTLVLLPVAAIGILLGLLTLGFGVLALGHIVGVRLPVRSRSIATALGTAIVVVALRASAPIPIIGSIVPPAALLGGLGAVVITYFGLTRFQPDALPADGQTPRTELTRPSQTTTERTIS